jgi:hypothetical protein
MNPSRGINLKPRRREKSIRDTTNSPHSNTTLGVVAYFREWGEGRGGMTAYKFLSKNRSIRGTEYQFKQRVIAEAINRKEQRTENRESARSEAI